MKQKDYNPVRCKSPMKQNVDQHLISVPYNRNPSTSLKKLPSLETEKVRNRSSSHSVVQDSIFKKSETYSPIHQPGQTKTPSPINSLEKNLEGAKLANQDFEFIRLPSKSITPGKLKRPGNPIAELESIGKKNEKNEDEPPFNFQGMLRKTNFKRDSVKRNDAEPQYYNTLKKSKDSNIIENESDENVPDVDVIRYELAPGIFIEGKEASV